MSCDVVKQRKHWRMSCDVGEVTERLENELCVRDALLDGNWEFSAGRKHNLTARPQPCVNSVLLAKSVRGPFGVTSGISFTTRKTTENPDRNSANGGFDPDRYFAPRLLCRMPSSWDRFC